MSKNDPNRACKITGMNLHSKLFLKSCDECRAQIYRPHIAEVLNVKELRASPMRAQGVGAGVTDCAVGHGR